jgi:hypothetical protein
VTTQKPRESLNENWIASGTEEISHHSVGNDSDLKKATYLHPDVSVDSDLMSPASPRTAPSEIARWLRTKDIKWETLFEA